MEFNEEKHEYVHNKQVYTSVTQLLKKYGLSADYDGIPDQVLAKAASKGKAVHKALELFIGGDQSMLGLVDEVDLFNKYIKDTGIDLTKAASEQMVFSDKYLIAGTIDFQYEQDGEQIVADFKTTSSLHIDTVAWQLSIYNYLKVNGDVMNYYFKKIKAFHFINKKLHVKEINLIDFDQVEALLKANLAGLPDFTYVKSTKVIGDSDAKFLMQLSTEIASYNEVLNRLQTQQDEILNRAKEEMIKQNDYFYRSDDFDLVYMTPQHRRSLDNTAVKEYILSKGDDPENFMKETVTKDGIKLRVKK